MAKEDFSTYTETDPNSRIVVGTRRVAWTDLIRNEDAYVYKDKGVDFFDGGFIHYLTIRATGYSGSAGTVNMGAYWGLANLVDNWVGIDLADGDGLFLWARIDAGDGDQFIYLAEIDGGTSYTTANAYRITVNTTYYLKIVRDESVGTYGTIYCYTYTDSARTALINTQSITLHSSKKDYRYLYAFCNAGSGSDWGHSGYTEDLELFSVLTGDLELANMALTNFTDTTVTGNAVIIRTGLSSVTEHGHCWGTSLDPTTADSKTTNGAGSLGVFSSSITGLIAGQQYYTRAYATNSEGTAYGPNIKFIAGRKGTVLVAGDIAIVQAKLHYVGTDGQEYEVQGIAV